MIDTLGDSYNSNSYWKGLLNAANIHSPDIELDLPGQNKPVPEEHFRDL